MRRAGLSQLGRQLLPRPRAGGDQENGIDRAAQVLWRPSRAAMRHIGVAMRQPRAQFGPFGVGQGAPRSCGKGVWGEGDGHFRIPGSDRNMNLDPCPEASGSALVPVRPLGAALPVAGVACFEPGRLRGRTRGAAGGSGSVKGRSATPIGLSVANGETPPRCVLLLQLALLTASNYGNAPQSWKRSWPAL